LYFEISFQVRDREGLVRPSAPPELSFTLLDRWILPDIEVFWRFSLSRVFLGNPLELLRLSKTHPPKSRAFVGVKGRVDFFGGSDTKLLFVPFIVQVPPSGKFPLGRVVPRVFPRIMELIRPYFSVDVFFPPASAP